MLSKPGLILQHGHDGPPVRFGDWLGDRGLPFVVHHVDRGGPLPDPRAHAFVASLGSERSVTETDGWVPAGGGGRGGRAGGRAGGGGRARGRSRRAWVGEVRARGSDRRKP